MRITLERHGGFAGRKRTVALDAAQLTEAEARELERLVAAADLERLAAALREAARDPAPPGADRFTYRLVVTGSEQLVIEVRDADVPGPLRPLLAWLLARATWAEAGDGGRSNQGV